MNQKPVLPPWAPPFVQALNLLQTAAQPGGPTHPYTCESRGDGRHGREGGDLGVLIATTDGWVCPHCDYTQDWALPVPIEIDPIALIGPSGIETLGPTRDQQQSLVETRIAAYTALAARGARGADVMLRSLRARLDEILATPAALGMWVVYAHPSDFPDEFVARRFTIDGGRECATDEILRAASLDALRRLAPPRLGRIPRNPSDDPVIVECWL